MENSNNKAQVVYFSHGGGPLPILGEPSHGQMVKFMKKLPSRLKKPEAIVVISAHWEENEVAIQGAQNPPMLYDYYGFPDEAFKVTYPATGSQKYVDKITDILDRQGVKSTIDNKRGIDHGFFIPLMFMYPNADIPAFQVSILRSLDAADHIKLGKALSALMKENVLILGSGSSFHNMQSFNLTETKEDSKNSVFQDYLIETCTADMPQEEREKKLIAWESVPNARYCHPREDHLLPLHMCVGITGRKAELVFNDYILGRRTVAFLWE